MKAERGFQFTPEDEAGLKRAIVEEVIKRPPTIGLIGVSGTGKSSTINAMFKTNLAISHVVACTKEFRDNDLKVKISSGEAKGQDALLRIIDAPGLGEDLARDPIYLKMYNENLSRCDVILWVLTARNRAIALDQMYLKELNHYHKKMVFGINQVDLVEPMDWEAKTNLPSQEQEKNINIIKSDRKDKIESILGRPIRIIPYSAKHRYNLQELFTAIVESCPENRAWIFSAIKGFRLEESIPEPVRKEIMQILEREEKTNKAKKGRFRL